MNKDQAQCCVFCGSRLAKTGTRSFAYFLGIALVFIGFIPLGLGISNIYAVVSVEQMEQGTPLEDYEDIQRINDNTRNLGLAEAGIGSILVVVGLLCIGYAYQSTSAQAATPSTQSKLTSRTHPAAQRRIQKKGLLDNLLDNPFYLLDNFFLPDARPRRKITKNSSGIAARKKANKFCKGCGRQLEADWKVCPSCGLEIH